MSAIIAFREERRSMTFRIPTTAIDLIDRAVSLTHKDRTAFIVEAASERAKEILLDQTVFSLPESAYDAFVAALDNPPEPNKCLKAIAAKKPLWEQ
jgi:uncharacterized protein (DUF1778 family)